MQASCERVVTTTSLWCVVLLCYAIRINKRGRQIDLLLEKIRKGLKFENNMATV